MGEKVHFFRTKMGSAIDTKKKTDKRENRPNGNLKRRDPNQKRN